HLLASIVAPAFFALTLILAARPLQSWLVAHRVPRMLAAVPVLLGLYVILAVVLLATAASLAQAALELPKYAGAFQSMYTDVIDWLATFGIDEAALTWIIQNIDLIRVA